MRLPSPTELQNIKATPPWLLGAPLDISFTSMPELWKISGTRWIDVVQLPPPSFHPLSHSIPLSFTASFSPSSIHSGSLHPCQGCTSSRPQPSVSVLFDYYLSLCHEPPGPWLHSWILQLPPVLTSATSFFITLFNGWMMVKTPPKWGHKYCLDTLFPIVLFAFQISSYVIT